MRGSGDGCPGGRFRSEVRPLHGTPDAANKPLAEADGHRTRQGAFARSPVGLSRFSARETSNARDLRSRVFVERHLSRRPVAATCGVRSEQRRSASATLPGHEPGHEELDGIGRRASGTARRESA